MKEIELILTDLFRCSRINLYSDASMILLSGSQFRRLDKILKDRAMHIPLAYSLGYTEFMGLRLKVNRDVLIPRPETEILVETVIEKIRNQKSEVRGQKILDIGTGSGCIAIALAKFLNNVEILAIDKSKNALIAAGKNSKMYGVENRIRFLNSDLFSNKIFKDGFEFDIIVSNPPYVPTQEIGIFDETTVYEPKIALDGGRDGCDIYRRLSKEAGKFLKDDGFLFLEIGDGQSDNIKEIFSDNWITEEFRKDYQGIERICIVRKSNG